MLRLAASPTVINNQVLCHDAGELRTIVLLDHAQCEVDARGHAC